MLAASSHAQRPAPTQLAEEALRLTEQISDPSRRLPLQRDLALVQAMHDRRLALDTLKRATMSMDQIRDEDSSLSKVLRSAPFRIGVRAVTNWGVSRVVAQLVSLLPASGQAMIYEAFKLHGTLTDPFYSVTELRYRALSGYLGSGALPGIQAVEDYLAESQADSMPASPVIQYKQALTIELIEAASALDPYVALDHARALSGPRYRATALLVAAAGLSGVDAQLAKAALADAFEATRQIPVKRDGIVLQAWVARTAFDVDADLAARLLAETLDGARQLDDPRERVGALAAVVRSAGQTHAALAESVLGDAEALADTLSDSAASTDALAGLAEASVDFDVARASSLAAKAEARLGPAPAVDRGKEIAATAVKAVSGMRLIDTHEDVMLRRSRLQGRLAAAIMAVDASGAVRLVGTIPDPKIRLAETARFACFRSTYGSIADADPAINAVEGQYRSLTEQRPAPSRLGRLVGKMALGKADETPELREARVHLARAWTELGWRVLGSDPERSVTCFRRALDVAMSAMAAAGQGQGDAGATEWAVSAVWQSAFTGLMRTRPRVAVEVMGSWLQSVRVAKSDGRISLRGLPPGWPDVFLDLVRADPDAATMLLESPSDAALRVAVRIVFADAVVERGGNGAPALLADAERHANDIKKDAERFTALSMLAAVTARRDDALCERAVTAAAKLGARMDAGAWDDAGDELGAAIVRLNATHPAWAVQLARAISDAETKARILWGMAVQQSVGGVPGS